MATCRLSCVADSGSQQQSAVLNRAFFCRSGLNCLFITLCANCLEKVPAGLAHKLPRQFDGKGKENYLQSIFCITLHKETLFFYGKKSCAGVSYY